MCGQAQRAPVIGTDEDGSMHINTTAGKSSRVFVNGVDIDTLDNEVRREHL